MSLTIVPIVQILIFIRTYAIYVLIDIKIGTIVSLLISGPQRKRTCLQGFANNKGTDTPAHPRSLISAFVIRDLEKKVPYLSLLQAKFHFF